MLITVTDNVFPEGHRAWFRLASNKMQYFEIGARQSDTAWLEGIVTPAGRRDEFLFNGRIYVPGVEARVVQFESFPKGPAPAGWRIIQHAADGGHDLVSIETGDAIFGYKVDDGVCVITTNIYGSSSELWAETADDDLLIHRGPARLGRHGLQVS